MWHRNPKAKTFMLRKCQKKSKVSLHSSMNMCKSALFTNYDYGLKHSYVL